MIRTVSVVMAVCNGRRYLRPQLTSVIDQLRDGDELIVIDDASTDGSADLVASEATRGPATLVLHRNACNLGIRRTFEKGLGLARNDIVFLCDQDDVWLPGKRDVVVQTFDQHPNASIVISDAEIIDAEGERLAPSFMATRNGFRGGLLDTLWASRFLGCAMAVRREILTAALPIPSRAPMHDMWLGAIGGLFGRVVYLSTPLLQYRRHLQNASPATRRAWPTVLRWRFGLATAVLFRVLSLRLALHRPGGESARPS